MKILVVSTVTPFAQGCAETISLNLTRALNETGGIHAELVRIPSLSTPPFGTLEEILFNQSIVVERADRIIGLQFPSYLIPHKHKTLWILQNSPWSSDYDDLWPESNSIYAPATEKSIVRNANINCFEQCESIYAASSAREKAFSSYAHMSGIVLLPPIDNEYLFSGGKYGGYIFCGGDVSRQNRQHLLIEAMARTSGAGKLVIGGPVESDAYKAELLSLIAHHSLEDRVELRLGRHSRQVVAGWVNDALACAYVPGAVADLGFGAMEACCAGKALLTTTDAEDVLHILQPNAGIIVAPHVDDLAEGLAALWEYPKKTMQMGLAAQSAWRHRKLDWTSTVTTLLS